MSCVTDWATNLRRVNALLQLGSRSVFREIEYPVENKQSSSEMIPNSYFVGDYVAYLVTSAGC
jgi:hypothetical protein